MCPLRVILLFLSAILAGYFAFKTVREQGNSSILSVDEDEPEQAMEQTSIATKVCTAEFDRCAAQPLRSFPPPVCDVRLHFPW